MSRTLFANVRIFDGTGSPSFPGEVLVDGNRIAAVACGSAQLDQTGACVIDGQGSTLMPGLIEPHAHLTFASAVDRIVTDRNPPVEQHLFYTAHNAKTLLDYGYTATFSAGATKPRVEVAVRDEINAGFIPGPRMTASSFEREISGERIGYGSGVDEVRRFVTEMADLGVDSLKFVLSGRGALNPAEYGTINYSEDELAAAAELAHERGLWLSTHAQAPDAVKQAVRYGFRALYHCNFADEEALDMMEEHKDRLFCAPAVGIIVADMDRFSTREEQVSHGLFQSLDGFHAVIPEMRKRGIRVLPGGDYGFPHNPNGRNARDMELLVRDFGFTTAEVLTAATKWGAELLERGHELGQVKAGYLADLLLIDGDPLQNVTLFQDKDNLLMIMQDGTFYKESRRERVGAGARQVIQTDWRGGQIGELPHPSV